MNKQQLKLFALTEAITGTVVGLGIAVAVNLIVYPLLGVPVNLSQVSWVAVILTIVSVIRSYTLRRFFHWIYIKYWG